MRKSLSYISVLIVSLFFIFKLTVSSVYGVTYPVGVPSGEVAGGTFNTYFSNMFGSGITDVVLDYTKGCPSGEVMRGLSNTGIILCVSPGLNVTSSSTLALSGELIGTQNYVTKYDNLAGTGIGNSQIYDNGTNVGIANISPAYKLDVAGTGSFYGLRVASGAMNGYVLTSDATGIATWAIAPTPCVPAGTGINNTCYGVGALFNNSTGYDNVAVGRDSLLNNNTGFFNLAIGSNSLRSNTSGFGNTANGKTSLYSNISGNMNTADGVSALYANSISSNNTAIGFYALVANVTGNSNTVIGYLAGQNLTAGDNNTALGSNTDFANTTGSNQLNIANIIFGTGLTGTVGAPVGSVGIGTTNPLRRLAINGGGFAFQEVGGANRSIHWGDEATGIFPVLISGLSSSGNEYLGFSTNTFGNAGIERVRINAVGDVGIGTTTPGAKLEVAGQIKITGGAPGVNKVLSSDASGLATWVSLSSVSGVWSLLGNSGTVAGTNFLGTTDGQDLVFKTNNVEVARILTSGNVGIGTIAPGAKLEVAGQVKITGGGIGSGKVLTSDATGLASWTTAPSPCISSGTGTNNTCYGSNVLQLNTTGSNNTANGFQSLYSNTVGFSNTANGFQSLYSNTGGAQNTAFGVNSLHFNTLGINNTANGFHSLYKNVGGSNNTGLGTSSMYENITGSNNTAIGFQSLFAQTTGSNNTVLGYNTALGITTGSNNTILGANVAGLASGLSNNIIIADGNGNQRINVDATGNVGIGIATPGAKLEVAGQVKITGGTPGLGKTLISDAVGLATWGVPSISNTVYATGVIALGSSGGYITKFMTAGSGITSSILFETGGKLGIGTTNPAYMFDMQGSGSIIRVGSGMCLGTGCITNWSDLNNIVKSMGTPHYLAKFNSGGFIDNSQIYETGGKLYIGDIPAILTGGATIANITVKAFGSTNSSNPLLTLSENGAQECRMWLNGANKIGSNCAWTAGTSGFGLQPNQIPRADATGDALTGSNMYQVGTNVGIGISTGLAANLHVSGSTLVTGNLTVQGKVITDTIINRTVNNVSISGSLLPDSAAPLTYRDIGSATQRWNNLYLSGQISIKGGAPGLGKILMSDANGLATWSSSVSGATATGITGGTQNYIPKFGTGGTGLYLSQFFDNGTNVGIGTVSPTTKLTLDSGMAGTGGLRFTRISSTSTPYAGSYMGLGLDASGNVVPVSNGDVVVYTGVGRNGTTPNPNPDIPNRLVRYDFNRYFAIPSSQSFVVSDGNGAGFNAPYFKENGISGLCSWDGTNGSSPYDCAIADPFTGLSASPNNSFTMTARGINYGYQLALGARGDAPLFARSGKWVNGGSTNYASGLYLSDGVTPTPWQKVLTVPANHLEYFYVNIGYNSQLQAITGGGNIGIGTSIPDRRLVIASSGTTSAASGQLMIRRGFQGADAALSNIYGTPYVNIGGLENRVGALQTIGFGYSSLIAKAPAEIGFLTTSTTGNTQGDIVFANRNGTTNVAPTEVMRIESTGDVGIGVTNPTQQLQLSKSMSIPATTGSSTGVIYKGATRFIHNYTASAFSPNLFIGLNAGNFTMTQGYNIGIGDSTLMDNTSGFSNMAVGYLALSNNTTGGNNAAIGSESLELNTSGNNNVANGFKSLYANTTGGQNTSIGTESLTANVGGANNTANGYQSLYGNTSGNYNIAIGGQSLFTNISGQNNTAVGYQALRLANSPSNNTALGYLAGNAITTGASNITIGANAQVGSPTGSNQLSIGNWLYGSGGNIGIGIAAPTAKLEIAGNFKLGTNGTVTTAAGVCTIAASVITTTATVKTCTGVPASTAVAVNCTAAAAFTTPNTTSLYCRANGTLSQLVCNTTVANSVSTTYKCMWMQ